MFRLPRVIIRPSLEQIQDYLSSSCTLGSQALTIGGINIVKVHICILYLYVLDKHFGMTNIKKSCRENENTFCVQ